ncbi:unnamed protein product [Rhizophagus irregularis]|nr:unnamed protein product [Rhizophagus irregularis]
MSNSLSGKIFNFLTTSPLEHITAFSVIFQAMEEEPLIKQDALRNIVNNAVNLATNTYSNNILAQNKLLMVSMQFDVAYEGVRSLRDIEISKTIESPISREEIAKNMRELKSKLKGKSSQLAVEMCQLLEKVNIDNLTWQKPLATTLPPTIQEKCKTFIKDFRIENIDEFSQKLSHTGTWKEREEDLLQVTEKILDTLSNIWKNPAFEPQNAKFQSEGTYITDVIVPVIRSALKIFQLENQLLLAQCEEKLNELIFTESSRLICIDSKEENDKIKLWREMNDGMAYIYKGCRPDNDEFGILRIQVAGEMMHLSVLIKDINDVQRLYHLQSIIIPVQPTDAEILTHFVEALLVLRNITIVNNSLLFHASRSKSNRLRRKSSTVSSDKE